MPLISLQSNIVKENKEPSFQVSDLEGINIAMELGNDIYIDGAGWNGKCCKICIASNRNSYKIIEYWEEQTNNQMEYLALLNAIEYAKTCTIGYNTLNVSTDSELMYKQLTGKYKTRNIGLLFLQERLQALLNEVTFSLDLHWIPREENIAGIILDKNK